MPTKVTMPKLGESVAEGVTVDGPQRRYCLGGVARAVGILGVSASRPDDACGKPRQRLFSQMVRREGQRLVARWRRPERIEPGGAVTVLADHPGELGRAYYQPNLLLGDAFPSGSGTDGLRYG